MIKELAHCLITVITAFAAYYLMGEITEPPKDLGAKTTTEFMRNDTLRYLAPMLILITSGAIRCICCKNKKKEIADI